MPFDPDAYLAKKSGGGGAVAGGGGFDPDAYLAKKGATPAPPAAAMQQQAPPQGGSGYKSYNPVNMTGDEIQQRMDEYMGAGKRLISGPSFSPPVIGPLMEKAGSGIAAVIQAPFTDKTIGQHYDENMEGIRKQREDYERKDPEAAFAKNLLSQVPFGGPAGKIPGGALGNIATQTGYNTGVSYADARLRDKSADEAADEARTSGTWTAMLSSLGPLAGFAGKAYSRGMAGIRPETLERYRGRAPEINALSEDVAQTRLGDAAEDIRGRSQSIKDETDSLTRDLSAQGRAEASMREQQAMDKSRRARDVGMQQADEIQRGVSEDLSKAQKTARKAVNESAMEAMRLAEESGTMIKIAPFKATLTQRLNDFNVGNTRMGGGVEVLERLRERLDDIGVKEIPASEFRMLIKSIDDEIGDIMGKTAKAGYITPAERELTGVRKGWSEKMKDEVPGYRGQMEKTAGKTQTLEGFREQFSYDPDDIYRELKGIEGVGKRDRMGSLQQFEKEFGGDYTQRLGEARSKRDFDYDQLAKPEKARAEEMRSQDMRDYFQDRYGESDRLKDLSSGLTRKNAQSTLRRYGNNPEKNIELGRRLKEVAREMNLDPEEFTRMAEDLAVKRAMEGTFIRGSRNVNQSAFSLQGMAHALGASPDAGITAKAVGGIIGAASDIMGPRVVKKVVDFVDSPMGRKYASFFRGASERGPRAIALTHDLLMKNDPEYRQAVGEDEP
jgi:hypothetical protein